MAALAERERFEEAGLVRDRLRSLAEVLQRGRQEAWLVAAGSMVLVTDQGARVRLAGASVDRGDGAAPIPLPCPRERADELAAVRSWIASHQGVRLEQVDVPPAEPVDGGRALAGVLAAVRASSSPPTGRRAHDRG
jgi:hypothetical protein